MKPHDAYRDFKPQHWLNVHMADLKTWLTQKNETVKFAAVIHHRTQLYFSDNKAAFYDFMLEIPHARELVGGFRDGVVVMYERGPVETIMRTWTELGAEAWIVPWDLGHITIANEKEVVKLNSSQIIRSSKIHFEFTLDQVKKGV